MSISSANDYSLIGDKGLYILNTASWRTERPVMDKGACIECGICMTYCPVCSIQWAAGEKTYFIDYSHCKGCGICAHECPHKAINMVCEGEGENK